MKYTISLFLSLLIMGNALAQTDKTDSTSSRGFAIRFLFDGFRPSGGLGAKLWISETSAMALSLTGRSDKDAQPGYSNLLQTISLIIDYEKHWPISKDLNLFGLATTSIAYLRSQYIHDNSIYSSDRREWMPALGVGWGAEYWVTDRISFSASQSINYRYRYSIDENRHSSSGYVAVSYLLVSVYF